jgi:hypothetical protein
MVTISTKQATDKLVRNFIQLDDKHIKSAIVNAINRSLMKGRTEARKSVKAEYNIPQKNLGGIDKENATRANLTGYIMASTTPIPMDAFAPNFQVVTAGDVIRGIQQISKKGIASVKLGGNKRQLGVSIEVHKGQREVVSFAFMIRGGKPRVFARGQYRTGGSFGFVQRHKRINKGGSDIPVKPLLSVTVHAAVINDKVESNIAKIIEPYYIQRLEHELNFQLSKMNS